MASHCDNENYLCLPMLVGHFGPVGLVSGTVVGILDKDYLVVGIVKFDCQGLSPPWFELGNLTYLWVVWAVQS